ncbi:hypothetical protein ACWIYZ_04245 [Ursidibacter arcticus]
MGGDVSDYRLVIEPEITELLAQQNQLLDKQNQVFDKLNGTLSNVSDTLSTTLTSLSENISKLDNTLTNAYKCSSWPLDVISIPKCCSMWVGIVIILVLFALIVIFRCIYKDSARCTGCSLTEIKNTICNRKKVSSIIMLVAIAALYPFQNTSVFNLDNGNYAFRFDYFFIYFFISLMVLVVLNLLLVEAIKLEEDGDNKNKKNEKAASSTDQLNNPE